MKTSYVSGYDRVRQLAELTGPFFWSATVRLLLDCSVDAVDVYLSRWQKAGLICRMGPRAGVFMNTLYPQWQQHVEAAIAAVYPAAVVIGTAVMHERGYTTQVPRRKTLIVPHRGPSLDPQLGFDVAVVGVRRYVHFSRDARADVGMLPRAGTSASFEYALEVEQHLHPDDIDFDEIARCEPAVAEQLQALVEVYETDVHGAAATRPGV
jgi:hypothetical protein